MLHALHGHIFRRGHQSEVYVHGLKRQRGVVGCGDVAAGDVVDEGAVGCGGGGQGDDAAQAFARGHATGHDAHGGTFDVAFDTSDLSGEAQAWHGFQAQVRVEHFR